MMKATVNQKVANESPVVYTAGLALGASQAICPIPFASIRTKRITTNRAALVLFLYTYSIFLEF